MEQIEHTIQIPAELAGKRLDQALAQLFPDYSRAKLQEWLKTGNILINNRTLRAKEKIKGGEIVAISAVLEPKERWVAQEIPLEIIYEDNAILIINKPAGLVVHPAAGNRDGTLVNALLNYAPELETLPRAGLIHRLDKDTSGLLVVARTLPAYTKLVSALQAREVKREYFALVHGVMTGGRTIEAPIGRHPHNRLKMAVIASGKPAVTHIRVLERLPKHTALTVTLETGRTHQIRVHLAHIKYPIVGDPLYGNPNRPPKFHRQALHAQKIGLAHPSSAEYQEWQIPLPEDIYQVLGFQKPNTW